MALWNSRDDVWAMMFPQGEEGGGYWLYATSNGGRTWKPLLDAPFVEASASPGVTRS